MTKIIVFLIIVLSAEMVYSQQTFITNQSANLVIGQSNFTSSSGSCSQESVNGPSYCAVSSKGMLAVADQIGYRTLLWNSSVISNGQLPDFVLGENSFTDCSGGLTQSLTTHINGVAFSPDGNKIIISDAGNQRVLIWNSIPTSNGQPADVVLGQTDFTSSSAGTASDKFNVPLGIYVSASGKLIVSDTYNNRVLIWNSIPLTNGTAADVVVGQPDFTSFTSGNTANKMYYPWGVWVSPGGKLIVADCNNNRVLVFNTIPVSNNSNADVVIGQTGFGLNTSGLSQTQFNVPIGVTVSPDGKLAIGEFFNNRVLIYNSIPLSNGASADVVLGQPDFNTGTIFYPSGTATSKNMNRPYNVSFDLYGRLFVAGRDMNRVMIYGTLPSQQAELQIQISVGNTNFCPGSSSVITVSIKNNGPNTATGVISTASLPATFNYSSSSATNGTYIPVSGYWSIPSLASGVTAILTINGVSTISGIYSAYANIIQSNQLDNNLNNNGTSIVYNVNCPCTGTPNAGTTVSTANPVCSGVNFTLSLTGATSASGLTYQWLSSNDNITYNIISGATNSTYITSLTSSKYYRCKIICSNSGLSSSSTPLNVTINPITNCYCTPAVSPDACGYMWITNVSTIGGVSNFNNNSVCTSSSYTNYSGSYTASNAQLGTTTMSFTSAGYALAFSVWIDYDDNGLFESSEQVIANNNPAQAFTLTDNFTVPPEAIPGTHRMRVRGDYFNYGAPADPCYALAAGETEDYTFTVIAAVPCTGSPNPGNTISTLNPVCSGTDFTLSLQNNVAAIGISYQWQLSADNINFINITGATNSTYTANQTSSKYYRCRVTCSNNGLTVNSTSLNVTMNSNLNCYCIPFNPSCNGDYISNFKIPGTTLDNTSTCVTTNGSAYSSFPAGGSTTATLIQGMPYTFSVTTTYDNIISVWIDYDHSGTFDTNEWAQICTTSVSGVENTINFTISPGALLGTTGLRIRSRMYGNQNDATSACLGFGSGETEDYKVNIIAATPCSGTPNTGTTFSTANPVCSGVNFTLSLTGSNLLYSGINYQWQSSTDNITFSNISGATGSTCFISQTSAKYYRCRVTCSNSGISSNSTSLNVTMNPFTNCYCTPSVSPDACGYMWITNVTTIGGISNFNNISDCTPSSYTNYSGSYTASNTQLGTTTMSFTSAGYPLAFSVWIDYNDNGLFESSERVISNNNFEQAFTFTENFTVPITAVPGTHRMRVRGDYFNFGAPADPCYTLAAGETEDYSFTVIAAVPCTGSPNPGNTISTLNPVCSGNDFTLSLQNNVAAIGISYQWQLSTDNINFNNITGATNSTYTTSQTSSKYYRCRVTCSNNGSTINSTSLNVTINPIIGCYCIPFNPSCSGDYISNFQIQGTTLNNTSTCVTTNGSAYSSFPAGGSTTATLIHGTIYTFSVTTTYDNIISIWIDYDHNGTFDTNEWAQVCTTSVSGVANSISFTVSSGSLLGQTGLRIRSRAYGNQNDSTSACIGFGSGETEDYIINIIAATPCSGTPNAGTTVSTANPVCSSVDFTLGLSGATIANGLSYQWQSSADNITFNNISGATTATYITSQTSSKYYRCRVTCSNSGISSNSISLNITINPVLNCFCVPAVSPDACGYMWITNVATTGGISNFNNSSVCAPTSYIDYSGSYIASNIQLSTTTMSFTSAGYALAFSVWIDYNDDGFFEFSEQVIANNNTAQVNTFTDNFTIPLSALPGTHRMRVRGDYFNFGAPADPCDELAAGETEDYAFTVIAALPCSGSPNPGNTISSLNPVCPGTDFTLSLQNNVAAIGISYQWQSSADNIIYNNISGATNSTYTTSQTSSKYYRCRVTCSNNGSTVNSTSLNVTVNPILDCYCIPVNPSCSGDYISNFQIQGTTLNNTSTCVTTNGSAYSSFPTGGSTTATLIQGITYTFSVTTTYDNIISVWIDYDHSGTFDANEWAQVCTTSVAGVANSISLTISSGSLPGQTGLRIRSRAYGNPNDATSACIGFGSGETEDYIINIITSTPCSGTPNTGTTVSTVNPACSGVDFMLSLSGAAITNGLLYQWQSSADNITFSNITGATTATYVTSQTSPKYYRCRVTCSNSGLSSNSISLNITMNPVSNCFCVPAVSPDACGYMWITNVATIGGISNFNNSSVCAPSSYTDYSGSNIASNIQQSTTTMSFTSAGYALAFSVWIDYNDNGMFESLEKVISNNNSSQAYTVTDSFMLSNNANSGTHKMRVRGDYYNYGAPVDPCNSLNVGETEDYAFIVTCTVPLAAPIIIANGSLLMSSTANTYQWYFNSSLINGATSQFYNATQPGLYQVQITNAYGCSAISDPYNYVGIESAVLENSIIIYPNPANTMITVEIKNSMLRNFQISIYNIISQLIISERINNQSRIEIDVSSLAKDIYFLKIQTNYGTIIKKLVIQ